MPCGNLIYEVWIQIRWLWKNSISLAIGSLLEIYNIYFILFTMLDFKKDFPIFIKHPWLVYLDNASTTHKPTFVVDAVSDFVSQQYANIHRGNYDLSYEAESVYIDSKKAVAKLLWCQFSEIAYHYNATACSNMIAQSLCYSGKVWRWDTVVLWIRDHHATVVVWQKLQKHFGFTIRYIPIDPQTYAIDRDAFSWLLDATVKVVACSHVSNVTWSIYDMKKIRAFIGSDVFFIVDGSQSVPNFGVDVKDIWCDCLFWTAHKMLAYTWLGVMYLSNKHIESLDPLCVGGGVIDDVTTQWHGLVHGIEKFEAGTPNVIGAASLLAALRYIDWIGGYGTLHGIEQANIVYVLTKIATLPSSIRLIGLDSSDARIGVFSFATDENAIDVADRLADANICVRVGGHCAHPLLYHLKEQQLLRMSCYLYTTKEDIDRFFSVLMQ